MSFSPHWASRRISRHLSSINIGVTNATNNVKKRLFIASALETIASPSATISRRAAIARKVLDDIISADPNSENSLIEKLRILAEDSIAAELLYDVITGKLTNVYDMASLRATWLQAKGLFSGEDTVEVSGGQNMVLQKSKLFFLANYCVEMLHYLLQYLLQFSFKNDEYLRYWEERELEYQHWYYVETTPWFWFRYLLQKNKREQHNKNNTNNNNNNSNSNNNRSNNSSSGGLLQHPKRTMRIKLKIVRELRRVIAESIGRLTAQLNAFSKVRGIDGVISAIESTRLQTRIVLSIFRQVAEFLDGNGIRISGDIPNTTNSENGNNLNFGNLEDFENFSSRPVRMSNEWFSKTYVQLGDCTTTFESEFVILASRLKTARIPNWYSTHWMQIGAGAIACYYVTKNIYESRDSIVQYAKDSYYAAIRFWQEHLEQPLKNIWEVIRYDKTTLAVSNELSMKQDVESLCRMVADFAKENNVNLTQEDISQLMQNVQLGDLSPVLTAYEQNIKSPIRNVVFGDLIRLLLIQIQKQKVDLEKAMAALDQLLRANELNFQFLATIPAVLLIGGTAFQVRNLFRRKAPNRVLYAAIHSDMRNLERMLNVSVNPHVDSSDPAPPVARVGDMSYESYGLLLHITTRLQYLADQLAGRSKVWFEEDLKEIESEKTDATQKLSTIRRMYHTYPFLQHSS